MAFAVLTSMMLTLVAMLHHWHRGTHLTVSMFTVLHIVLGASGDGKKQHPYQ
ncbi:hypothetical protein NFC81_00780 [Salinispirillum sp. LH 10-3-1]|uniref:Uncharacterized protein n=1 Tax=Salinispirillum sp. LH 10-3-1 TaxID=2952525 RepID=A0AB38YG33_9GAMM